jgi:8-oxo-dGTP diphosphatase
MLPGGKREPGEDDLAALARELREELGVTLVSAEPLGVFEAAAANEPGAHVRSHAYRVVVAGEIAAAAEISELRWIDPAAPNLRLAPLLETEILPALAATASRPGKRAPGRRSPSGSRP